jgi:uncharacterized protein DUF3823
MKNSFKYLFIIFIITTIFSCKKDNYSPPNAILSGNLLYQGDTIYVERNAVHFQIYQYGFGKVGPISTDETFAQNGSYSAALFNGDYKLIVPNGDGPFMWKQTTAGTPDSVSVTMNGSQTVDLQVTPYYLIQNTQISASGGNVTASFKIDKVITDANAKDIESVSLFINKTQFVSGNNNIARIDLAGADIVNPSSVSLSVAVPSITPTQSYVFARVGLKIAGVEDLIFSPLIQVSY